MKKTKFYSRFILVLCISLSLPLFLSSEKTKKKDQDLFNESVLDRL
ncbi:MAG: hypothetical protein ACETWK_04995 [Candidatus Aminicenantaceae bacterium]